MARRLGVYSFLSRSPRAGVRRLHSHGAYLAVSASIFWNTVAGAEEVRRPSEPLVFREPGELLSVVDAWDNDDVFELHIGLGFESSWRSSRIKRESTVRPAGTGPQWSPVAQFHELTSRLIAQTDIGLYRDLALTARLPIALSKESQLGLPSGGSDPSLLHGAAPDELLFSVPFRAPNRSGVEYLAVGLNALLTNQMRDSSLPTWLVGGEVRLSVSEALHACNASTEAVNLKFSGAQLNCADPADASRFDGKRARTPGVSRDVTGVQAHTYLSRRIKHVEPYVGLDVLLEIQNAGSDFGPFGWGGAKSNHPPVRANALLGLYVIPWEIRDQFQRTLLDFRLTSSYVSEGQDYSELFDALGSSDAPSLRTPNFSEYQRNPDETTRRNTPSVVNPASRARYFSGIMTVEGHALYTLQTEFTWQAGQYIKFKAGGAYSLVQAHLLAHDTPCIESPEVELDRAGSCYTGQGDVLQATGLPNVHFRHALSAPGQRFKVDDSHVLKAWVNATVMF